MRNKPIKQHYIPQFILRHFGEGKKKREKIWTFDKETGRSFCGNVADAGHENKFYESTNLDGDTIEGEPLLARLDAESAPAIKNVVCDEVLPIWDGKTVVDLSYFVAAQMFRGPSVRNDMMAWQEQVIRKWGPDVRAGDDERPIGAYGPDDAKHTSIETLSCVPEFAQLLQEKIWFLLKAPLGHHFILSDNPVVRHNHINYWPRGSLGLNQKGIEAYLPISPRLSLYFVCPTIAEKLRFSRLGHIYLQAQNTGLPVIADAENVEFVNSLQVLFSERFLYAKSERDFMIAREMLAKNGDLRRPASVRSTDDPKPVAGWNLVPNQ